MLYKILFVQQITHFLCHHLHHFEIRSPDHHPFTVVTDAQQTHESAQTAQSRVISSASHSIRNIDFRTIDIGNFSLHIRFDIGYFPFGDLCVIFLQNECQSRLFFPNTANQIFLFRKILQTFFQYLYNLIRIFKRTSGRHHDTDVERVWSNFFHLLHIQGQWQNQRCKKQDHSSKDCHSRITHTSLQ